jgi:hypothetical protein
MDNAIVIKKLLLALLRRQYPEIVDVVVSVRKDPMLEYRTDYFIYIGVAYKDLLNINASKIMNDAREIVYDVAGGRNSFNSVSIQTYDPNN